MKALRSPAVLVGLLALLVVVAATLFVRPLRREISEVPQVTRHGEGIPGAGGTQEAEAGSSAPAKAESDKTAAAPAFRWEVITGIMEKGGAGVEKQISREEAERFLKLKGETALNLLAAATNTGDSEFARRAAARFPEHPAVQLWVLANNKNLPAAERAEWIERFKTSAPDNPLPFLYAAQQAFQQNDPAAALALASAAVERPGFYLWSTEYEDAAQQLFEWKGYTPLEAQLLSAFSQSLPYLSDFQKLGADLVKLRDEAVKTNDSATADEALRATYGLGRIFQSPEGSRTLINQLVGISLESRALKALPPEVQPAFLDIPRAQREAEITSLKDSVRGSAEIGTALLTRQDTLLLAGYLQRYRDEGEYRALLWLKEQIK